MKYQAGWITNWIKIARILKEESQLQFIKAISTTGENVYVLSQRSFSFLCCHRLSIFFSPFLCLSVYTHLHTGRGKMLKKRHHWLLLGYGRLRWFVAHFSVFFCMAFFFLVKSIIILIKNSCFFKSSSMAPGFTSFLEKVYNVWNHNCILPLF